MTLHSAGNMLPRGRECVTSHCHAYTHVDAPRRRFIALPLAVEGADGSPVRAVAVVE